MKHLLEHSDIRPSKRRCVAECLNCYLDLPVEVQYKDMLSVAQVCRKWNQISQDELLWKSFCLREIECDLEGNLPRGVENWKAYYHQIHFYNALRKLGTELLSHVMVTAGPYWRAVVFRVEKCGDATYLLHQQICRESEPSEQDRDINEIEYGKVVSALGIVEESRELFCSQLVEDIGQLCSRWNVPWDRSLLCLYHKEGKGFSDPVELVLGEAASEKFENDITLQVSENEQIFGTIVKSVRIFPQECSVNVNILQRVLQVCQNLNRESDHEMRHLLQTTERTQVDFEHSVVRVFQQNDLSPQLIPFQVIGTYFPEFLNWRWSWKCDFKPEQYEEIVKIREQSKAEGWPETKLLSHPSIDCELVFAMAIAHLCATRMGKGTVVYATPREGENDLPEIDANARIFLALQIPTEA